MSENESPATEQGSSTTNEGAEVEEILVLSEDRRVKEEDDHSDEAGRIRRRRAVLSRRPVLIDYDAPPVEETPTPEPEPEPEPAPDFNMEAIENALKAEQSVPAADSSEAAEEEQDSTAHSEIGASLRNTMAGLRKAAMVDPSENFAALPDDEEAISDVEPEAVPGATPNEDAEVDLTSAENEAEEADPIESVFAEPTQDDLFDEANLRDMVSDIVREELQGELGERITRNVRKLVRREIQNALMARGID